MTFRKHKKTNDQFQDNKQNSQEAYTKKNIVFIVLFSVFILIFCGIYFTDSRKKHEAEFTQQALSLAKSINALIPSDIKKELTGSIKDLDNPNYQIVKQDLIQLIAVNHAIHFASIIGLSEDKLVVLVDSEGKLSSYFNAPGTILKDVDEDFYLAVQRGQTTLQRVNDSRGQWVSVFVPIAEETTLLPSVLVVYYSLNEWNEQLWQHMNSVILTIVCILGLSVALVYTVLQNIRRKSLVRQIALSEVFYRTVFDKAPIGIAVIDSQGFVADLPDISISNNKKFEQILKRSADELKKTNWLTMTHPQDLNQDLYYYEKFRNNEIDGYTLQKRYLTGDDCEVWVNMIISSFSNSNLMEDDHLCILQDITSQKQMEENFLESERSKTLLLQNLPGLAYRCHFDSEWTMQFVSDRCLELTGYKAEDLLSNQTVSFNDIIAVEYRESLWNEWERVLANREFFKFEYEIVTASGQRKWVLEVGHGVYGDNDEVVALEGIILDISAQKEVERNLQFVYQHDRWTGLLNRESLETQLQRDAMKQLNTKRALISVNISTLNPLTLNYGFSYTQRLIKYISETLSHFITDTCQLYMTFPNRFAFYMSDYQDDEKLSEFTKEIAKRIEKEHTVDQIGGGIGVVQIHQNQHMSIEELTRAALIASEQAIKTFEGSFGVSFYDEQLDQQVNREREILLELSNLATSNNHDDMLVLHFQPIYDLKSQSITGFEALSRLVSETLGTVSPLEFIPLAEETKRIIPIGKKIIRKAFHFLNQMVALGEKTVRISINISAIQLFAPGFTTDLLSIINEMKVNPANIGLEITESIFSTDYRQINSIIKELRDIGIQIAIDDFGTGYSSLAREKELNVNCLKIDRVFIERLSTIDPNRSITRDIIAMAHRMGHVVIAEGVEDETQMRYLIEYDCDKVQGYYVGRPMDESTALEFLKNNKKRGTSNG